MSIFGLNLLDGAGNYLVSSEAIIPRFLGKLSYHSEQVVGGSTYVYYTLQVALSVNLSNILVFARSNPQMGKIECRSSSASYPAQGYAIITCTIVYNTTTNPRVSGGEIDYYAFEVGAKAQSSDTHGLRMFSASGEVTFDSGWAVNDFLRVKRLIKIANPLTAIPGTVYVDAGLTKPALLLNCVGGSVQTVSAKSTRNSAQTFYASSDPTQDPSTESTTYYTVFWSEILNAYVHPYVSHYQTLTVQVGSVQQKNESLNSYTYTRDRIEFTKTLPEGPYSTVYGNNVGDVQKVWGSSLPFNIPVIDGAEYD